MFKDYDRYLSASLKVYLFLLVVIFIMKIVGLDYFGLDVNNPTLIKISNFLSKTGYSDSIIALTIYLQFYLYLCIVCNKRHLFMYALIGTLFNLVAQAILGYFAKMEWIYYFYSFSLMIVMPMIVNKKFFIKKQIKLLLLISLYQLISYCIRSVGIYENINNFVVDTLLNIDQLLMLAITYNVCFMGGGEIMVMAMALDLVDVVLMMAMLG